jgi:hypothetical protein
VLEPNMTALTLYVTLIALSCVTRQQAMCSKVFLWNSDYLYVVNKLHTHAWLAEHLHKLLSACCLYQVEPIYKLHSVRLL